jgi:hypothetical protein
MTVAGDQVALAFAALRSTPAGDQVALAFGLEGPDPPLPPPDRYAYVSAGMPWGVQPRRRRLLRIPYGLAPRATKAVEVPWGDALRAIVAAEVRWQRVPAARAAVDVPWEGAARLDAGSTAMPWQHIPRVQAAATIPWLGDIDRAAVGASLPWRNPPRQSVDAQLPWRMPPLHLTLAGLPWRSAPQQPVRVVLLWGQAGAVRWFVGSPGVDPPGPVPPWVNPRPPGGRVALRFLCPRVAPRALANAIPLAFGRAQCAIAWPRPRRYIVLNTASVVRLPERTPIAVESGRISASRDNAFRSFDLDLADPAHLALLRPGEDGPKSVEINLNGYVWTAIIESWTRNRRHLLDGGSGETVSVSGRSRPALLAAPWAPVRAHVVAVDRLSQQLIDDELDGTDFTATVPADWSWLIDGGAYHYDGLTPMDAISRVAGAAGAVALSHPWDDVIDIRPAYPVSPWAWSVTPPDVQIPVDVILQDGRGAGAGERASESITIPLWPPSATDMPRLVEPLDLVEVVEEESHKALAAAVEITFRRERSSNGAAALVVEQSIVLDPAPAEPLYNQVLVSGEQVGVSDPIIRDGTAGDVRLASVIDPLITTHAVARERGRIALAAGTAQRASSNLWSSLVGLQPTAPQRKGNVTALNPDGSYTIATADGGTLRARPLPGQTWEIGVGVFIRDGRIVDSAPSLASVSQVV